MISLADTRGETESRADRCFAVNEGETTTQEDFESRREKLTAHRHGRRIQSYFERKSFLAAQLDSLGFQIWNFEFFFLLSGCYFYYSCFNLVY